MNKKDNVLYISYDGMTDPLGQSQVLPYLTHLSNEFNITILSAEKQNNFDLRKKTIQSICDKNTITWEPFFYTKTPPVFSTIKDIFQLFKKAKALHKATPFSIIHCRSYISAMVGLSFKRKYNTRFIFDMRGFWADERVDGGIWKLKNPLYHFIYKFFKKKEIEYFENADFTISLTNAGKKEIHQWKNIKNNPIPIEVIPCCADLDHFSRGNINTDLVTRFRNELNIKEEDFVLNYLGSIGTWYMLNEMLDFFKVLDQSKPNVKLFFVTGDDPKTILSTASEKGIDLNKIIIKRGERNELPSLLSLSTISFFFILPVFSKKASSPTKQAELLALGIPIICNGNVGDTGDIIRNNNAGYVIDSFENSAYQVAINNIDNLLEIEKEHLRTVANQYASLNLGVEKYSSVYKKVITKK